MIRREFPNALVVFRRQIDIGDMLRAWKCSINIPQEPTGKVLVEQQLHANATVSFFSRSAAKAKQA